MLNRFNAASTTAAESWDTIDNKNQNRWRKQAKKNWNGENTFLLLVEVDVDCRHGWRENSSYLFDFTFSISLLLAPFFAFRFSLLSPFALPVDCWVPAILREMHAATMWFSIFASFIAFVLSPWIVCLWRICTWNLGKVVLKILLIADSNSSHIYIEASCLAIPF